MAAAKSYYATGRRKTATARIFLKPGSGKMTINGETPEKYLARGVSRMVVNQPFAVTNNEAKFDLYITVSGGGEHGQAGAIRHGISRALVSYDEKLRPALKAAGLLTRDSRMVERKKYGKPGARKSFQFSKR